MIAFNKNVNLAKALFT